MNARGLFHAILTCVTAGPGLGFNRAVLFLADEEDRHLEATMAIGPGSAEEAQETWARLEGGAHSLEELLLHPSSEGPRTSFQRQVEGLTIDIAGGGDDTATKNPLLEAYRARRVVKIVDSSELSRIPAPLREIFAGTEVVCVPLFAHDRTVGLLIADNAFTRTPITEERIQLLLLLAMLSAQALDGVRVYRELERQADQLRVTLDELRSTQEHLIRSERLAAVGAVVARVSHEIRNPLSTIGGFARALAKHPGDLERGRRNTGIIVSEVEKLEALLKEMLDFTSPHTPVLGAADINEVVAGLANVHRDHLAAQDVVLDVCLDSRAPRIHIDRNQVQRALLNLIQNGVQATEGVQEPQRRRLRLRTWDDPHHAFVSVQDDGPGIAPDVLRNIFTPFFTTKPRGSGLGLAVVKKIMDDHQATIDIETRPGAGTAFILAFPLTR